MHTDKVLSAFKNSGVGTGGFLIYGTDEKFYSGICFAHLFQTNVVNKSRIISIVLDTTLSKEFIQTYLEFLFHKLCEVATISLGEGTLNSNKYLAIMELKNKDENFLKERPALNFYNLVVARLLGNEFCPKNGDFKPRNNSKDIFVDYNVKILADNNRQGNSNHFLDDDLWSFARALGEKLSRDELYYTLESSATVIKYLESVQNMMTLGKPYADFFKKYPNIKGNSAITKGLTKEYEKIRVMSI
jgi:hypothetical protein